MVLLMNLYYNCHNQIFIFLKTKTGHCGQYTNSSMILFSFFPKVRKGILIHIVKMS